MEDLGLPAPLHAVHEFLLALPLPLQVEVPYWMGGAPMEREEEHDFDGEVSEEEATNTKRHAWFGSLAAFYAFQPASHQINLQVEEFDCIWSSALPATQAALSPWITSLAINVVKTDDIGKTIKSMIEVGQSSLTQHAAPLATTSC